MLYENHSSQSARQQGVILLVVISLLTLFAIVGISFVLYANAEANASRIFRAAEAQNRADMDPEMLLNYFLGQLIYDVNDDSSGVYSGLRGHSLARSMYGQPFITLQGTVTAQSPTITLANPSNSLFPGMKIFGPGIQAGSVIVSIASPQVININQPAQGNGPTTLGFYVPSTIAFNGTGRLHTSGMPTPTYMNPFYLPPYNSAIDDYQLVNYTYYPNDQIPFVRDPEVNSPYTVPGAPVLPSPRGTYTGGANAPYTYPDLNNMFLAAMKADGTVLMPSFHRHWLFNPSSSFNDPSTNTNWGDPRVVGPNPPPIGYTPAQIQGKYLLLRPRPVDQLLPDPTNPGFLERFPPNRPYFDYPEDPGGDVKNFPGPGYLYVNPATGQQTYYNNDSVWMDLNAPVMVAPDGTKFKALFAPLIIDLDGRLNLNVAGNVRGIEQQLDQQPPPLISPGSVPLQTAHRSNQGWGPWEMNLESIFSLPGSSGGAEWPNLFLGNGSVTGRYGANQVVANTNNPPFGDGTTPHVYAQVDYDASNERNGYTVTGPIQLPQTGALALVTSFPSFPQGTQANQYGQGGFGNGSDGGPGTEHWRHPLLYNYFQPAGDDRAFPMSNMEALLRYGDTNSPALTSDLFRFCPTNFQANARVRNLVTTHSFDVDQPGLSPWAIPGSINYSLNTGQLYPQGQPVGFPSLSNRNQQANQQAGEFGADWRAIDAQLGRINLNRTLTPYTPNTMNQANLDRQQFAADIFVRLVAVTGVYDIFNPIDPTTNMPRPVGTQQQFDALRWLAQLAANIVDYIDSDDVMTAFNWVSPSNSGYANYYQNYSQFQIAINQFQTAAGSMDKLTSTPGWVYGTELPKLVINEAYAQYQQIPPSTGPYTVDVWAELHNPLNNDPGDVANNFVAGNNNNGAAILFNANPLPGYSVYQVVLANTNSALLRAPGNVAGTVPTTGDNIYPTTPGGTTKNIVQFQLGSPTVLPCNGVAGQSPPVPLPTGFFVVGPMGGKWNSKAMPQPPPTKPPYSQPGFNVVQGASLTSPNLMTYQTTLPPGSTTPPAPTILLQRLVNPYAQPNDPASTNPQFPYNPSLPPNIYVTVDYMEGGFLPPPPGAPNPGNWIVQQAQDSTHVPVTSRVSYGRTQPYAAFKTQIQKQQQGPNGQAVNTFYSVNNSANLAKPFNWITHLDRKLISPMELLNVSGFKPHELTQQFNAVAYNNQQLIPQQPPPPGSSVTQCYYGHRVPWFDEDFATLTPPQPSHCLWRLFEFLETTGTGAAGMTPGGRFPGKININTVWDAEIFRAIADPQTSNGLVFTQGSSDQRGVDYIFQNFIQLRSRNGYPGPADTASAKGDTPLVGMAAAFTAQGDSQYPQGSGMGRTVFEPPLSGPNAQGNQFALLQIPSNLLIPPTVPTQAAHPYMQDMLLTKIFNNLTTRSNTFAVFLTVGFFQVVDDTVRPVKLGAEIGKAENRNVRHRMFAIVDRTNLATDKNNPNTIQPPPVYVVGSLPYPPPPATPNPSTMAIPDGQFSQGVLPSGAIATAIGGIYEGIPWSIQGPVNAAGGNPPLFGTNILIDTGVNQEMVNVTGVANGQPPTLTVASAGKSHAGPIAVTPVSTITAYGTITKGTGPTAQIQVSAVNGVFENRPWQLQATTPSQPGTNILLDTGPNVESATVLQITQPAIPGQPWTLVIQTTNANGQFQFTHQQPVGTVVGFPISYPVPTPGNPGPQANFDMRQVPWVVRHVSIIN